ncbi:MAG: hypothetical protein ACREFY_06970 [Acetobacteraceae bacterium]
MPTLLGAVSETLGMDRLLKSNTSKTRTHSLFRHGCMLYDPIPIMPEHSLDPADLEVPGSRIKRSRVRQHVRRGRNEGISGGFSQSFAALSLPDCIPLLPAFTACGWLSGR